MYNLKTVQLVHTEDGKHVIKKKLCSVTNKIHTVIYDAEGYNKWKSGAYIQDSFTNLTDCEREFLVSSTTPDEWDKMFPPEEEELTEEQKQAEIDNEQKRFEIAMGEANGHEVPDELRNEGICQGCWKNVPIVRGNLCESCWLEDNPEDKDGIEGVDFKVDKGISHDEIPEQ